MFVCVCSAVTESQIHQVVNSGAKTLRDLRQGVMTLQLA